jgi:enoyl-CoA hydratase
METGIRIGAHRAQEIGLVQEVVPPGEALGRALTLAREMAAYPQASLRVDRTTVLSASGRTLAEGLAVERGTCRNALDQEDVRQRLGEFARGSRPASPQAARGE